MKITNKNLDNKSLFWKIWILHYFVYYWTFLSIFSIGSMICNKGYFTGEISAILFSPIIAMTGIFDCMIIILPLIVCRMFKIKFDIFKSFVFTLLSNYSILIFYFIFTGSKYFISYRVECYNEYAPALIIIPCLILSIGVNYIVFRKTYKKIGINYIC